jgi:hypothetical protein
VVLHGRTGVQGVLLSHPVTSIFSGTRIGYLIVSLLVLPELQWLKGISSSGDGDLLVKRKLLAYKTL